MTDESMALSDRQERKKQARAKEIEILEKRIPKLQAKLEHLKMLNDRNIFNEPLFYRRDSQRKGRLLWGLP